ncbi:hypothetical protein K7432_009161 [Basidiobolus ranarum]|uniref:Sulfotransferase n=1 Tax=Basidiobolus ranarum TaxID=34480 RepID=A0ABR2VXY8_9FUNG
MVNNSNLEVIGAGFGRTGTMSLKAALDKLGYRTYHMIVAVSKPEVYSPLWVEAAEGNPNWDKIFDGYNATVDNPACWWYKDLYQRSPDAKVILTVRDPERWYKSCHDTVHGLTKIMNKAIELGYATDEQKLVQEMIDKSTWGPTGCFQGRFEDKEWAINYFKQHVEEVKRTIPADKLLVFEVKDGWEPLCKFLGKPIPDEPFPNVNDTNEMKERIKQLIKNFPPEIQEEMQDPN